VSGRRGARRSEARSRRACSVFVLVLVVLLVGQQLWSRVEHVVRASRSRYCEWWSCSRLDPWHVLAASDRQKALSLLDHVVLVGPVRRRLHRQPLCRLRRPRPRIVVRPERPGKRANERSAKREARVRASGRASAPQSSSLPTCSSPHRPILRAPFSGGQCGASCLRASSPAPGHSCLPAPRTARSEPRARRKTFFL